MGILYFALEFWLTIELIMSMYSLIIYINNKPISIVELRK